jgi:hypothetical protein
MWQQYLLDIPSRPMAEFDVRTMLLAKPPNDDFQRLDNRRFLPFGGDVDCGISTLSPQLI